jgi:hypothetical protein
MVARGWAVAELTRSQEGLTLITNGIAIYRATGALYQSPFWLLLLAEAHARLESPLEALNCLIEVQQFIERTDERFNEPELYRLRGDLESPIGDRETPRL